MDEWDYEYAGNLRENDQDIMVIDIGHKENGSRINHTAQIFVNLEDYAIIQCRFDYRWNKNSLTLFKKRANTSFPFSWSGTFSYKIFIRLISYINTSITMLHYTMPASASKM